MTSSDNFKVHSFDSWSSAAAPPCQGRRSRRRRSRKPL